MTTRTTADVPDRVREAALAAFDARDSRAVVADLVADSLLDHRTPPFPDSRVLQFSAPDVTVEMHVREVGDLRHISARFDPPGTGFVSLRRREEQETVEAAATIGDLRQIELPAVPTGLYSLRVHPNSGQHPGVQTAWVRL